MKSAIPYIILLSICVGVAVIISPSHNVARSSHVSISDNDVDD